LPDVPLIDTLPPIVIGRELNPAVIVLQHHPCGNGVAARRRQSRRPIRATKGELRRVAEVVTGTRRAVPVTPCAR
jgi:hypothetical protein